MVDWFKFHWLLLRDVLIVAFIFGCGFIGGWIA